MRKKGGSRKKVAFRIPTTDSLEDVRQLADNSPI
jgi:hypothetical protein